MGAPVGDAQTTTRGMNRGSGPFRSGIIVRTFRRCQDGEIPPKLAWTLHRPKESLDPLAPKAVRAGRPDGTGQKKTCIEKENISTRVIALVVIMIGSVFVMSGAGGIVLETHGTG